MGSVARLNSAARSIQWRFALLFGAIYLAFYVGYCALPDPLLREKVYFYGIVRPAQAVINTVAPQERVLGAENHLQSATSRLDIVRGCDGSGFAFLLIAAIIAYRTRLKPTLFGIAGALALVYGLNELRIIALYFLNAHRPQWFTTVHVYFIPSLMIFVSTLYFALWAAGTADENEPLGAR